MSPEEVKAFNQRNRAKRAMACVHFNGVQHETCKAGVNYHALAGIGFGCWKRLPCMPKDDGADEVVACEKRQTETPEQTAAREADGDAAWERLKLAIAVASKWRSKPKPAANRSEVVECPCCGGRLLLTQSAHNGHVHGRCDSDGCVSWME